MSGSGSYQAGIIGELRAEWYLKRNRIRVIGRRFRAAHGEIDLVAKDGDTLVFVEVKYRPLGRIGSGVEAVNADKRRRVRSAARVYLAVNHCTDVPVRFDILEISRAGCRLLKNAF